MKRSFIALAAIALAGTVALPAMAGDTADQKTQTLSLAGIDINSDAGAEIVYQRIVNAADRVCVRVYSGRMTHREADLAKDCAANAVEASVNALGSNKVTKLHNAG